MALCVYLLHWHESCFIKSPRGDLLHTSTFRGMFPVLLSKKLFCLVKLKKKKRVSLLAISTCKMTYWCILFLGFVCVRVRGGESACSVPWHCFCTSLGLAYLIILLFPFLHTRSLPSPHLPLTCRAVGGAMFEVVQGENWCIISVLFAAPYSCLMPCTQLSRFEDLG